MPYPECDEPGRASPWHRRILARLRVRPDASRRCSGDDADMTDQQMFVAVLLFESTSPAARYRPLYREDVVVLWAPSLVDAQSEAERHGRQAEVSYENAMGETITDRLLHVVDVAPGLNDDLTTAADLYSRHFRSITAYRQFEPQLDGEPL